MSTNTADRYRRENPRHRLMVELVATGRTNSFIAEQLGFSEGAVSAIRGSPLFQQEVADAQAEMKAHALHRFAEQVAEQTVPSLQALVHVRDKEQARDADVINASGKIIDYALDLYVGRKDKDERRTMKVTIEGADLAGLLAASREVKAREQTVEAETVRVGENDQALAAGTQAQAQTQVEAGRIKPMTVQEFLDAEAQTDRE